MAKTTKSKSKKEANTENVDYEEIIENLQKDLKSMEAEKIEIEQDYQTKNTELSEEIEKLKAEYKELENNYNNLNDEQKDFVDNTTELETLVKENKSLKEGYADKVAALEEKESQIKELKRKCNAHENTIEQIKTNNSSLKKENKEVLNTYRDDKPLTCKYKYEIGQDVIVPGSYQNLPFKIMRYTGDSIEGPLYRVLSHQGNIEINFLPEKEIQIF